MRKPHGFAQTKRQLRENVKACSLRASHLPDSITAFSDAAWQCLQARKIVIPAQTEYPFASTMMGQRSAPKSSWKPANDDQQARAANKALAQFNRDSAFCWDTLSAALDDAVAGSKHYTRVVNARRKWRAEYDDRISFVVTNCTKDKASSAGIEASKKTQKMRDFVKQHGAVHYVAGSDRQFATAEDAASYQSTTKDAVQFAQAMVAYNSEETQRMIRMFDAENWDEPILSSSVKPESRNDDGLQED